METVEDQSAALEFLGQRESYDPAPDQAPVHIGTHGSHVFLVGDKAYKMKRAVSFPYMDYGTLERRLRFTEAELELNRRTAPELYLGIRRLTRNKDGVIAFDGAGEVLEYVLEMRRFDEEKLLDRMAERGELTPELIEVTAERIRRFHKDALPLAPGDAPGAGAAGTRSVIEENFEEFEAQPGYFPPIELTGYENLVRSAMQRLAPVLDRRLSDGKAKHCHGDLHLRNICLWNGVPTLFDGLEFNPQFACIDPLYDLAYFLSDLIIRDRADLATLAFNRYVIDGDYDGLECLPLFISTRSAVRAKIMVSIAEAQDSPEARSAMIEQSRLSFVAARAQISPATARIVAVGGFSGSGKSTLAKALAPLLAPVPGAIHLRSDVIRKRVFDIPLTEKLPNEAYQPDVSERVYELMLMRAQNAIERGYSVLLDAVNDREEDRHRISALAASTRAPFTGLWLDAPVDRLVARIKTRKGDVSDATVEVLHAQIGHGHGDLDAWIRIDAGGSPRDTLESARAQLFPMP